MEPDDKELEVVAGLLEEAKIISDIKEQKIFPRPERINDYLLFSIPLAVFNSRLETFPIFLKRENILNCEK